MCKALRGFSFLSAPLLSDAFGVLFLFENLLFLGELGDDDLAVAAAVAPFSYYGYMVLK